MTIPRPLSRPERLAWLRLARTPGVGPITFHRLLARFGDAESALDALPALSKGKTRPAPLEAAIEETERLAAMDGRLVASAEPDYPPLLREIGACPPLLATIGDVGLAARPCVAIVGAREASAAGLKLAHAFAEGLGALGFTVVSGMARGVDARAHAASLETGAVAVLAGGLDRPYPPQNLALFDQLRAKGLLLSEAPMGFQARARDFPRRNHLISGISLGVVVIEAAARSGTLITARAAAEQGREVMAVPGSPLDPRSRGCNDLLRNGAALVETASDVADILGVGQGRRRVERPAPAFLEPAPEAPSGRLAAELARLLSPTPIHLNELARLLAAPMSAVSAALMELELEGLAATLPGGYAASSGAAFRSS